LGLAAGELAGLGKCGGDRAPARGQCLQIPIAAKLLQSDPMGGARFDRPICHQFECLERGPVLSPVLIGISEPLPRVPPRAINLIELSPVLRHPSSNSPDSKLLSFE